MYYDDETRRFNFLSGLLFGAVLGAGIALLANPQDALPSRRTRAHLKRRATRRLGRLRADVSDSLADAVTSGRGRLRR